MNYKHLLFFIGGYIILFFLLFPGYRFVMDPDATGYFSVAEHLAKGDFYNSINGIWSPLGSWILAPFLKFGFDAVVTEKYLNGLYGLISLIAFFYFIKKFRIDFFNEIAIIATALLLILYFVFSRQFGDLLQVQFLLLYLNIICSKNFNKNYTGIILAAVIGGIGFYAKAYIFYFTLVHLSLAIYLSEENFSEKIITKQIIQKILIAIAVLFFVSSFWILTLQSKYGHFVIGEKQITGTLSAQYSQQRVIIYPPPYKDSYSVFDDISFFKFKTITPFTSVKLFTNQCKLIFFNFLSLIKCLNEFSFASIIIILTGFFLFFKKRVFMNKTTLLLLSFIAVWPSGFLLFHVESRFLWIIALCILALAGIIFTPVLNSSKEKIYYLFFFLIAGSFCLYAITELQVQYGTGKNYFEIADAFKKNNIKGNILTANQSDQDLSKSIVINYLAKCRHYGPFVRDYTTEEILEAVKTYNINYFISYYATPYQKQLLLTSNLALNATYVYKDIYPGIIVLSFNK